MIKWVSLILSALAAAALLFSILHRNSSTNAAAAGTPTMAPVEATRPTGLDDNAARTGRSAIFNADPWPIAHWAESADTVPSWCIRYGEEFWRKQGATTQRDLPGASHGKVLGAFSLSDAVMRSGHSFVSDDQRGIAKAESSSYTAGLDADGVRFSPHLPRAEPDADVRAEMKRVTDHHVARAERIPERLRGRSDESLERQLAALDRLARRPVADPQTELTWQTRSVRIGEQTVYQRTNRSAPQWLIFRNTAQAQLSDGFIEHIEARNDGLEISWILKDRPGVYGDMVIEALLNGLTPAGKTARGDHFTDASGIERVRASPAVAVDSSGRRWPVHTSVSSGGLLLVQVPAKVLEAAHYPLAIDPTLTPEFGKDINTDMASATADLSELTAFNGMLFFQAYTPLTGYELWKSDGTEGGTVLVRDINPWNESSYPDGLAVLGTSLFFSAATSANGTELWKTDGTSNGTVLVRDIRPGDGSSYPQELTAVSTTLFFRASNSDAVGYELWKSDGSSNGTVLVRDIDSLDSIPEELTAVGTTLFFRAYSSASGIELWRSGGTSNTTVLVRDIYGGGDSFPQELTAVGSTTVYFTADNGVSGVELWKSGGTSNSTVLVRDLDTLTDYVPEQLTAVGTSLYFVVNDDDAHGDELWRSHGASNSTILVRDINPGGTGSFPWDLTALDTTLYFNAFHPDSGFELWRSDGTSNGTYLVRDIDPVGSGFPGILTALGTALYFNASGSSEGGYELWKSDGTSNGTMLVRNINPTVFESGNPQFLTAVGSNLFFTADNGINGIELWKSDGTSNGTVLIKDINAIPESFPSGFTPLGNYMYFGADDGVHGGELWKSDGTPGGTMIVADINPGAGWGVAPVELTITVISTTLYFAANDGFSGWELWKSDGTSNGTMLVRDIGSFNGLNFFNNSFAVRGATLFFRAEDDDHGNELWKSDGTSNGTVLVRDIYPGSLGSYPYYLTPLGTTLFFSADNGTLGDELWRSDGTSNGTRIVRDIAPTGDPSYPANLTPLGTSLIFSADNGTLGDELWRSDGTSNGTVLVRNINTISFESSFPASLTVIGTNVYFSADNGVHGAELWRSGGTSNSTVLVRDIFPGGATNSSSPFWLTAVGSTLYFNATGGTNGYELWKSDGTSNGTVLVKDIRPGAPSGDPMLLTASTSNLFFSANDGVNGRELWLSDGSTTGTVYFDLLPGPGGSDPFAITARSNDLFFSAIDATRGRELWWIVTAGAFDTDNDGIPDFWETLYGLNPLVSNGPNDNADSDEMTDIEEYLTDTNPTNPASFWRSVTNFTGQGVGTLATFPTSTGRVYDVQWNTNLVQGIWTPYGFSLPGTGSNLMFIITNDAPTRAHRLTVRVP